MDFNDTPEEASFREEARAWLEANVPSRDELADLDEIAAAKLWQKRKYDAGWPASAGRRSTAGAARRPSNR